MEYTVLPAKSDSDVMVCLQLLSKTLTWSYSTWANALIDRLLVY